MQSREIETFGLAVNYGVSSGIGWFLAILAIASIREKLDTQIFRTIKRSWNYIYCDWPHGHRIP